MERKCKKCGTIEGIRLNFGNNDEAEKEFHSQDWCDCDTDNDKGTIQSDTSTDFAVRFARQLADRDDQELRNSRLRDEDHFGLSDKTW